MLFQIISLVGAVLILFAFGAQQLGRMRPETIAYQLLNLFGAICLCVTAVAARQVGFILLEGTWTVASAYGVWRVTR